MRSCVIANHSLLPTYWPTNSFNESREGITTCGICLSCFETKTLKIILQRIVSVSSPISPVHAWRSIPCELRPAHRRVAAYAHRPRPRPGTCPVKHPRLHALEWRGRAHAVLHSARPP